MAGRVDEGAGLYAVSGACLPTPRQFTPVLVVGDANIPVRVGSDEASLDPNAVGSYYWFLTGELNVYKFFAPVLDTEKTKVTSGKIKDIYFTLEGDTAGWAVDRKTGLMTGSFPIIAEESGQKQFVMDLVAWDIMKESAVIETFTFNARNPTFSPVLILGDSEMPLRAESDYGRFVVQDGTTLMRVPPNLNGLGSEYWFHAGEQNVYTIGSPALDPDATVLVAGTLEDVSFSLEGDTAGWTADRISGAMSGSWPYLPEEPIPGICSVACVYIMDLVATDVLGTAVVVETFTMNVMNPEFLPVLKKDDAGLPLRAGSGDGSTDIGAVESGYFFLAGELHAYKIFPPRMDLELTALSKGTVADITYSLAGQAEGWTVDESTGVMTGTWPFLADDANPSTYTMQLVAADARGKTAVLEEFTFNVRNPVLTLVLEQNDVSGVVMRAGADDESVDPNTVGSDYWYLSVGELHSYKIFPPVLDQLRTIVTAGTVADITFSLSGDSDGWTVAAESGLMTGAWPYLKDDANPSVYVMQLVATDARGDTAVVETFTMNVKNPDFAPAVQTDAEGSVIRAGSGGDGSGDTGPLLDGTDPNLLAAHSWYLTDLPYKIYPPAINATATTVTQGTPNDITYALAGQSEGWAVDVATGVMTGVWPHLDEALTPAVYTMQLVAVDARGQVAVLEEHTMQVRNPTTTTTTTSATSTTITTSTTSATATTTSATSTTSTGTATTTSATQTTTTRTRTSTTTSRTTKTRTSTSKTKTTRTSTTATTSTQTRTTTSKTRTTRTKTTTTKTATSTSITGTTTTATSTTQTVTTTTVTSVTTTTTVTSSTTRTTTSRTTTTITTTTRTTTTGTTTTTTSSTTATSATTTTTVKLASPVPSNTSWLAIVVGALFGVLFVVLLIVLAVRLRRSGKERGAATRLSPAPIAASAGGYQGAYSSVPPATVLTNPGYSAAPTVIGSDGLRGYNFPAGLSYQTSPAASYSAQPGQYVLNNPGARRVAMLGPQGGSFVI